MKFIGPAFAEGDYWRSTLGRSRDELVAGILRGGWLAHPSPEAALKVRETADTPFTLCFDAYRNAEIMQNDRRINASDMRIELAFNYCGARDAIYLSDVNFSPVLKHKGMGSGFLRALLETALDAGVRRIKLNAGLEGSWFWTDRGAVIADPARAFARLQKRAKGILSARPDIHHGWAPADVGELERIMLEQDVMGLHRFAAREDLKLGAKGEKEPHRRILLRDIYLGPCLFDFDNEWTQERLKKKLGFDIAAERAARAEPVRPPAEAPAVRTAAPAF